MKDEKQDKYVDKILEKLTHNHYTVVVDTLKSLRENLITPNDRIIDRVIDLAFNSLSVYLRVEASATLGKIWKNLNLQKDAAYEILDLLREDIEPNKKISCLIILKNLGYSDERLIQGIADLYEKETNEEVKDAMYWTLKYLFDLNKPLKK